jgi:hypothetical protein
MRNCDQARVASAAKKKRGLMGVEPTIFGIIVD